MFSNIQNNSVDDVVYANYDVCVIGSGPAGTVIASSLAENGAKTLLIESGKGLMQWIFDSRLMNLAAYEFSGNTNYPLTKTKSRILGGNSNFWTGRCADCVNKR